MQLIKKLFWYARGFINYLIGYHITANPYLEHSLAWVMWNRGYSNTDFNYGERR